MQTCFQLRLNNARQLSRFGRFKPSTEFLRRYLNLQKVLFCIRDGRWSYINNS